MWIAFPCACSAASRIISPRPGCAYMSSLRSASVAPISRARVSWPSMSPARRPTRGELEIGVLQMQIGHARDGGQGEDERTRGNAGRIDAGAEGDAELAESGLEQTGGGGLKSGQELRAGRVQADAHSQAGEEGGQLQ